MVERDELVIIVWRKDVKCEAPSFVGYISLRDKREATGIKEMVEVTAKCN